MLWDWEFLFINKRKRAYDTAGNSEEVERSGSGSTLCFEEEKATCRPGF